MILNRGEIIGDRYEILDKLGSGGMANVYRAKDRKLDRFVTFKVMREEYATDEEFIKRFNVEAQAAAGLSNQNIVRVYDVGQEDGMRYIVMEYIDGVTLKDIIRKHAPFDNNEILGVAVQIATALEHAHKNNVVHRDIKPQNILVTTNGVIKVTDFGLARAATTGDTVTMSTNTMGSVHYFSPEQARGGYVDNKSDIYSLGIVMYEMATGKLPFDGETPISIALQHINEPLPDIKALNPKISDAVINIIHRATEKLSGNRYQTITEMSSDLKRALAGSATGKASFDESPTIRLSAEDIEEIKKEAAEKAQIADTKVGASKRRGYAPQEEFDREEDDEYEDEEEPGQMSEKKIVIAAILTAVLIIALISFLGFHFLISDKPEPTPIAAQPELVTIPNLIGLTQPEAEIQGTDIGFEVEVDPDGYKYSDTIAKNQIISQSVAQDEQIEKGGTVMIGLSYGTDKVKVPDVTGKEITVARQIFVDSDMPIQLSEEYEWSDDYAQNVVIRQDPPGGELIEPNTPVTLYISKGKEQKRISMPKLTGMTEAAAIDLARSMGLTVDTPDYAPSENTDEGMVSDQAIAPGTQIIADDTIVRFTVSNGKPEPTPTPTPDTAAQSSGVKMKSIPIGLTNIPEGLEQAHIIVIENTAENPSNVIFDDTVDVANLPITLTVEGEGMAEIIVFLVGDDGTNIEQARDFINFDEGTEPVAGEPSFSMNGSGTDSPSAPDASQTAASPVVSPDTEVSEP